MFWSYSACNSAPKKRRVGLWTRQAVLNIGLVCLAAGAVCGKQMLLHFSLFTTGATCASPPVKNVQLTDLYMIGAGAGTETLRVEWDGDAGATFLVGRTPGSINGPITNTNGHGVLIDTFAAQSGTKYVYSVSQIDPPPPPPPYPYVACTPAWSQPVPISVTPMQVMVSDNQSVDARYDPRYALWTHLNHNFGSTVNGQYVTNTYRGGLFAGYNGDNSQVGHAYLNFALPPNSQGKSLWPVSSVNVYYLRSYTPGSTSIGCRSVPTAWTGATLNWSTAPGPIAGGATPTATVSYGTQQPVPLPISGWTHWDMGAEMPAAVPGGAYAASLYGTSEPSTATDPIGGTVSGWAYFSKKECKQGQPACALYAYSN